MKTTQLPTVEADADLRKALTPHKLHLQVPHDANTLRDKQRVSWFQKHSSFYTGGWHHTLHLHWNAPHQCVKFRSYLLAIDHEAPLPPWGDHMITMLTPSCSQCCMLTVDTCFGVSYDSIKTRIYSKCSIRLWYEAWNVDHHVYGVVCAVARHICDTRYGTEQCWQVTKINRTSHYVRQTF